MKLVISLFLCFFSLPSMSNDDLYLWWVNYTIEPSNTSFKGISASEFSKDFDKITILTCDKEPTFTRKQCDEIRSNKFQLSITGDFNSNGNSEAWYTGVAISKDKKLFQFLFALDKEGALIQSIQFASSKPVFSIFRQRNNDLLWFSCMECGDFGYVKWSNNQWLVTWEDAYL